MSNEELQELYNKLEQIDYNLAAGLLKANDPYQYLRDIEPSLEGNSSYTDVYANLDDFIGDRNTRLAKFYISLKGNKPSASRMNSFLNKNSDITAEDVNAWFDKTNEYKEYYKQERAKEAGKTRRKREVEKEWSLWNKLISSDYEKQRYIEDPQSAIFGKEAPGFLGSSVGAKADLISGLGAGAVDIVTAPVPPLNVVAGPIIRAGRDAAHIAFDSPYQKDVTDVVKDFGTDVAFNAGASVLANTRKGARILSALTEPEVRSAYELSIVTDDIVKGLNKLPRPSNSQEFAFAVRNIPDSPLKQDLLSTFNKNGKLVDDVAADKIMNMYYRDVKTTWQNAYNIALTSTKAKMPNHSSYLTQVLTTPKPKGVIQDIEYGALRGMNKLNLGTPGTVVFETTRTAPGRGSKPEHVISNDEFEMKKNKYMQTEPRYWSAGFIPRKLEGDPLWEAYKEWHILTFGKDPEDK